MFSKKYSSPHIKQYAILNDSLYCLNIKGMLLQEDEFLFKCDGIEKSVHSIFCYSGEIAIETTIIFETKEIKRVPYLLNSHSFNGINSIAYNIHFKDVEKQVGLYYLDTSEISWFDNVKVFGENFRHFDTLFYKQASCELAALSISGQFNWQIDLTDYCKYSLPDQEVQGGIRKVLGVYDAKLWVWTDNSQLLVLDINTGEVLSRHRIPDLDSRLTYHGFLFPYFDEGNGVIAFLEHRFYIEFNLDTLQLSTLKSFDTGKPDTDWNFSINTFSDDYVYFTARRGPDRSSPSHLGVFNRQSMEIEWGQDLELWKTDPYCFLNQPPQYAAGKLYALDNKGTLHIFEQDDNA